MFSRGTACIVLLGLVKHSLVSHRPNIVYVASNHFVWRLVPVSISSQIQQLLQDKQFELALQLAVSLPSPSNLLLTFLQLQLVH